MSDEQTTPDLTETQVIIIGCVCASILIVLLTILIWIICKRRLRNKNYTNDPHSPRTVQQGNGALPNQKPRNYDNQGMTSLGVTTHDSHGNQGTVAPTNDPSNYTNNASLATNTVSYGVHLDNRNGFPVQYLSNPGDNYPMGDMSYDSHSYDKQYEYEMNRRNANISSDPYNYSEKQGDLSFSGGSPRTPIKDNQQYIGIPEEHTKEGGSFGSGQESGYSTPDKVKPKKVIYEVVV